MMFISELPHLEPGLFLACFIPFSEKQNTRGFSGNHMRYPTVSLPFFPWLQGYPALAVGSSEHSWSDLYVRYPEEGGSQALESRNYILQLEEWA